MPLLHNTPTNRLTIKLQRGAVLALPSAGINVVLVVLIGKQLYSI